MNFGDVAIDLYERAYYDRRTEPTNVGEETY